MNAFLEHVFIGDYTFVTFFFFIFIHFHWLVLFYYKLYISNASSFQSGMRRVLCMGTIAWFFSLSNLFAIRVVRFSSNIFIFIHSKNWYSHGWYIAFASMHKMILKTTLTHVFVNCIRHMSDSVWELFIFSTITFILLLRWMGCIFYLHVLTHAHHSFSFAYVLNPALYIILYTYTKSLMEQRHSVCIMIEYLNRKIPIMY